MKDKARVSGIVFLQKYFQDKDNLDFRIKYDDEVSSHVHFNPVLSKSEYLLISSTVLLLPVATYIVR